MHGYIYVCAHEIEVCMLAMQSGDMSDAYESHHYCNDMHLPYAATS